MATVSLRRASKSFGAVSILNDIDLEIADGEFMIFVGPSGSGKSTLLRLIAGLEDFTAGTLRIGEREMQDTPASGRGVAMVFQNYALYPHMTVARNIGFALETARMPKAEIAARTAEVARMLRIEALLERKPRQLSGGQRQRVAIGRALVRKPDVFLFDEPLSNLDADLRTEMRGEIARLHRELGTTMVYVTHDQTEAMTLADRIVVLRDGRIEQVGTPSELYESPANLFVAGFIGSPRMNIARAADLGLDGHLIGLRPEALRIGEGLLGARIERQEDLGHERLVYLRLASGELWVARRPADLPLPLGPEVRLGWNAEAVYHFAADGCLTSRGKALAA